MSLDTRPAAARLDALTVDIAVSGRRNAPVVRVLDEADLTVEPGAVTALVGESGCGKSMVAAALCGLLPPGATTRGELWIGERALTQTDPEWPRLRGRHVGVVPQGPSTSFTAVRTLGSQLDEVVRILDGPRGPEELCADVDLAAWVLDRYPHELSGGMIQRAALAAALAGAPSLLIADEPTSALDPALADDVWELLDTQAALGVAVLVITHDLDALRRADRRGSRCGSIAVMRAGRILTQSAPERLRQGAGDPYLSAFFQAVV